MQPSVGTYEWTVPAEVWHEGFNRLAVTASHLASPAAVGLSSDARMIIGSGFSPDHGAYALDLVRRNRGLREAMEIDLEAAA